MFVDKIETFLEKTQTLKEGKRKRQLTYRKFDNQNEVLSQKQRELDGITSKIKDLKRQIDNIKYYFQDEQVLQQQMISAENRVKEQAKLLQQLMDENVQLRKINSEQSEVLDTTQIRKEKKTQISNIKNEIRKLHKRQKLIK